MGVDLFFVLSGFLIAGQLLRPFECGLKPVYSRFFARRLFRTLPAYLVVVAAYFIFPVVRERPNIQPLWQFLTFTENLLIAPPLPKAFSHVWSLCVEEQFYLLLPATIALLAIRPSAAKVISVITMVFIVGIMLRGYLWLHSVALQPFNPAARPNAAPYMTLIYYPTWAQLDGLLAGVAAASIKSFRPRIWATLTARPNFLLALGAAGVGVSIAFFRDEVAGFLPAVFGYPLVACSLAMMVMAGSDARSLIGRNTVPGAGPLASGAYSLYLTHKAVFQGTAAVLQHAPAPVHSVGFVVAILAALAVGATLYWLVERPFLILRDRLEGPSRSPLVAPISAPAVVNYKPPTLLSLKISAPLGKTGPTGPSVRLISVHRADPNT
jgi:peptidoglycan/LPS O-acetylase OafA/YrhL